MGEENGIRAYFGALALSLPVPHNSCATSSDTTYRKLRTLIVQAGQKNMSSRLREELANAAESVGLHTSVPLDDPTLAPDDKVYFSKAPFEPAGLRPTSEDSLREWVISLVGRAAPFDRCYKPQEEFRIPGYKRYIDLLLHERGAAGRFAGFVVVEFEKSSPAGTVAQTRQYMEQLRSTALVEGKYVRGVIVSAEDHARERELLADLATHDIRWFVLDARLKELTA